MLTYRRTLSYSSVHAIYFAFPPNCYLCPFHCDTLLLFCISEDHTFNKMFQSCNRKSLNKTGNPSASGGFAPLDPPTRDLPWIRWWPSAVPRPLAEFRPPLTKNSWTRPWMMQMKIKQLLFHLWKIRAEGNSANNRVGRTAKNQYYCSTVTKIFSENSKNQPFK